MKYSIFAVENDDNDRRLDRVLRKFLPSMPLPLIYKNIRTGFIRVNNKKVANNTHVFVGDKIQIAAILFNEFLPLEKSLSEIDNTQLKKFSEKDIETLFKNEHIWIINKKKGIPVQKAQDEQISFDAIIRNLSEIPSSLSFTTGPLHRLDRQTSGVLCFSQSLKGARWFTEEMKHHHIGKYYLGIVLGQMDKEYEWRDGIEKNTNQKGFHTVHIIDGEHLTYAKPLGCGSYEGKTVTLVEFKIESGKTHQIRSQSAHHGYPLLGDSVYGGGGKGSDFFLHAQRLEFSPNDLGIPQRVNAPLPAYFLNTLRLYLPKLETNFILYV